MFARILRGTSHGYRGSLYGWTQGLGFQPRSRGSRSFRVCGPAYCTRFSERIFTEVRELGLKVIKHPFHLEMVKGTLPRSCHKRFVVQDVLYLEGCVKALKIAQLRFPEHAGLFESMIVDTRVELNLEYKEHQVYFGTERPFEIMSRACEGYVYFLADVAQNGRLVEIIGAFLPCYFVFLEMYHVYTKELASLDCKHPYYEFVKYYKELPVLACVEGMKKVVDDTLNAMTDEEKKVLIRKFSEVFNYSLEYERRFFDNVYDPEKTVYSGPCVVKSLKSIRERLLTMPCGSWVFWDLDDTIWTPELVLLRSANSVLLEKHICSLEAEYPNIEDLIWELYYCCDYRLVEEEILGLFSDLEERGIHAFGFTKRPSGYSTIRRMEEKLSREDLTLRQLNKLRVSFSSIFSKSKVMLNSILLKDGVIFAAHFDKGPLLEQLLGEAEELGVEVPPEVAFLDNLHENVRSVEIALKGRNIPLLVVHYRASDDLFDNGNIDYEAVNCQIRALHVESLFSASGIR